MTSPTERIDEMARRPQERYDFPARVTSQEACRREIRRISTSLDRAKARRDQRAAQYLRGRLSRADRVSTALAHRAADQGMTRWFERWLNGGPGWRYGTEDLM